MAVDINLIGVQPTLVSGTNIKTINSTTLLGAGDIVTSNLGNSNLESTALARFFTLSGNTSGNYLSIVNQAVSPLLRVQGDGRIGIGTNSPVPHAWERNKLYCKFCKSSFEIEVLQKAPNPVFTP